MNYIDHHIKTLDDLEFQIHNAYAQGKPVPTLAALVEVEKSRILVSILQELVRRGDVV